jgi:hypothetical protein
VILHVPSQNTSTIPTALQIRRLLHFADQGSDDGRPLPDLDGRLMPHTYYQIPSGRINTSSAAYLKTLYPAPNYVLHRQYHQLHQ